MHSLRPEPTRMKQLSGGRLCGSLLALHTNIRLGWKGLPRINTLAYYEHLWITEEKKFYNIGPWSHSK